MSADEGTLATDILRGSMAWVKEERKAQENGHISTSQSGPGRTW